jgi:hypothetical protein
VDPREYVHELGARLEDCTRSAERLALVSMLVATGSADAGPYIADALASETDEDAREQIRHALSAFDDPCA